MWLVWIGVAFLALRWFQIGWFASLSWWWVALPFGLALVWFEVIEPRTGLDRKRAFDEMEKNKQSRIKRALERDINAMRGRRR
jgi:small Trp-rich protein